MSNVYCVLDAVSGITLRALDAREDAGESDRKFVSDEECIVRQDNSVKLFNVKSGDLLSEIDNDSGVACLAACPRKCLIAIGVLNFTPSFKVLQVCLPRDKDSRRIKR